MRRLALMAVLAVIAVWVVTGCGNADEKVVVRITDNDGLIEPREVTVGYVNGRMDNMPPMMLPGAEGDEGRMDFLDEIIRKELMVVAALRLGLDSDERVPHAKEAFKENKSNDMLRNDLVVAPAKLTQREVEEYYDLRDTQFQLQQIVINNDEEKAQEAYRRVTEGAEDFGRVALEVSEAENAADEGRLMTQAWQDLHPAIGFGVQDLHKGDISEPIKIGQSYHIMKVTSRKVPTDREPLVGRHLVAIKNEGERSKQSLVERELVNEWIEGANIVWDDGAIDLALTRTDEAVAAELPPQSEDVTREDAMARMSAHIVPQFNEEEAAQQLVSFTVGGEDFTWTLGDYALMLEEVGGPETPKGETRNVIESFLRRRIFQKLTAHEKDARGYWESKEMAEFVEMKVEELIVNLVYNQEVLQKTEEPTTRDVKEYYSAHMAEFVAPPKVDLRQIIVGTESEANSLIQRLNEGTATFEELVEQYSIDGWSKARGGEIRDYYQGEGRLSYLQEPAFSLEVGEISRPVEAPGGYAILEILSKSPKRQKTLDEVRQSVSANLNTMRREERLKEYTDELKGTCEINILDENLRYVLDPTELRMQKEEERVVIKS